MKDLGYLHFFLGMEACRDTTGFHLTQSKYIHDILARTSILTCRSALLYHRVLVSLSMTVNHLMIPHFIAVLLEVSSIYH